MKVSLLILTMISTITMLHLINPICVGTLATRQTRIEIEDEDNRRKNISRIFLISLSEFWILHCARTVSVEIKLLLKDRDLLLFKQSPKRRFQMKERGITGLSRSTKLLTRCVS